MILTSLHNLLCTVPVICLIYFLTSMFLLIFINIFIHIGKSSYLDYYLFCLIISLIVLLIYIGWSTYSLTVVIKFYNEISSGVESGQQEGMLLQSCNTLQPVQPGGDVAVVWLPLFGCCGYRHPQQAPSNPYTQQGCNNQPNNIAIRYPS